MKELDCGCSATAARCTIMFYTQYSGICSKTIYHSWQISLSLVASKKWFVAAFYRQLSP